MDPKTTTGQSKVYERYFLQCPYHLAQGYLARSVADRAESREPGVLTLRAPIAGADLSKNVVVTFATGSDPMHFDQPWKLHWTPEGGGPYPEFDGVLTVRADEDYTSAILELQGEYAPPGGAAGKLFDLALGSRIASATAQSLLKEIAVSMLEHYRRDESAKKGAGSGAA